MENDERRLLKYATAIAREEVDYVCGSEYELPGGEHPHWAWWKRMATAVMQVADQERPPPEPGSTEEQIPDEILTLIVRRPYISTACETARALESAMIRHPEHHAELQLWRDRMHSRCRINNKFTGVLCACPHHSEGS